MDPKRGNAAPARQGASKTSVASRHGVTANANIARKYGSEVSLTPSQAKQGVDNTRKSPLDALSRANFRQDPFQRRSGLQDVDDSFMAANAFARPSRLRHSGLEANNQKAAAPAVAPIRVASSQELPQMQYQQQQQQMPQQQAAQSMQPPAATNVTSAQVPIQQQSQPPAQQQQQQQPPQQQQQQLAPANVVPAQQSLPQQQQQQAPQFVQPPAAGQPTRHEPYPSGRAHVHQQQQLQQNAYEQQEAQAQAQAQLQQQQQQMQHQQQQPPAQISPRKYQQLQQQQQQQPQQGYPSQAGGGAAGAVPPAAEMCTTCPNCQTTIYLVRTPELGHGDAGMPM